MAKNWAIVIGINEYINLPSLQYAKRDAECMRDFFLNEAGFEEVFLFTEDSPKIPASPSPIPTQPTFGNLSRFLRAQFEKPLMETGDNLWFFFAGHGQRYRERDYLMPCDVDPEDPEYRTAIPLGYVTERLRRSGADNVILLLDACRSETDKGSRDGLGIGIEQQQGVITIFSCSPKEKAYEIESLQQGSFTYALLQGLRIQGEGNCATVERLYKYLCYRVPEINHRYQKPRQTPYAIAEPASKYHLILLARYASLKDIETLKIEAFKAETEGDFELARQLWIRVNVAAGGSDMDAIMAFPRIFQRQGQSPVFSRSSVVTNTVGVRASISPSSPLQQPEPEVEQPYQPNIDYTNLINLLAQGKWKEADQETLAVMLKAVGREQEGWLDVESIEKFPCTDLRTINQHWVQYSNGRFGFSVQRNIWQEVKQREPVFCEHVGWRVRKKVKRLFWSYDYEYYLRSYDDFIFSLDAPVGHLPSIGLIGHWWVRSTAMGDTYGVWLGLIHALALKLEKCNST